MLSFRGFGVQGFRGSMVVRSLLLDLWCRRLVGRDFQALGELES